MVLRALLSDSERSVRNLMLLVGRAAGCGSMDVCCKDVSITISHMVILGFTFSILKVFVPDIDLGNGHCGCETVRFKRLYYDIQKSLLSRIFLWSVE